MAHVLRDVAESDLDAFYEHQREPEATKMALFPARDREAFDAHWQRLLADDSLIKKTIVHDGQVAGNIGCWEQDGRRLIGYWIGKEFGAAAWPRALAEFVEISRGPSTRGWQEATSARSACSRMRLRRRGLTHRARRDLRPAGRGGPLRARLAKLAIAEAGRRKARRREARAARP